MRLGSRCFVWVAIGTIVLTTIACGDSSPSGTDDSPAKPNASGGHGARPEDAGTNESIQASDGNISPSPESTADGGVSFDGAVDAQGPSNLDGGSPLACSKKPTTCNDVGQDQRAQEYGCCDGEKAYWCDSSGGTWALNSTDCAAEGKACKYNSEYRAMYCVEKTCTANSCPSGEECVNGQCVVDLGSAGPGTGPGPDCSGLPSMKCADGASSCGELGAFEPTQGAGYDNYPINGETEANQYRSFLRRDFQMLIKYAAAKTACKTEGWTTGKGGRLGLGDMSEKGGAIPGTSVGQPGHPAGTHTNGLDIDVAYFQVGTSDNSLRPICEHTQNGQEANHCTGRPTKLDPWRTAMFLGAIFENSSVRVVGVDGKAGPILDAALAKLCSNKWLSSYACSHLRMTYEITNQGNGWFYYHHHHMHISFKAPQYPTASVKECLIPGCDQGALDSFLRTVSDTQGAGPPAHEGASAPYDPVGRYPFE